MVEDSNVVVVVLVGDSRVGKTALVHRMAGYKRLKEVKEIEYKSAYDISLFSNITSLHSNIRNSYVVQKPTI